MCVDVVEVAGKNGIPLKLDTLSVPIIDSRNNTIIP